MKEITIFAVLEATLNEKLPSISVITPLDVSFSWILAPITGSPFISTTRPLTLTACMTTSESCTSAHIGAGTPAINAEAIIAEKRTLFDEFLRKSFFIKLNLKLILSNFYSIKYIY